MKSVLYLIVGYIARIHDWIGRLNDQWSVGLSDKALHFVVIGLLGMGMYAVLNPLFRWLTAKKLESVITWFYVMTVTVVITFAIEIGQKVTDTGTMEFGDIVFGVLGFVVLFAVYLAVRHIVTKIMRLIRRAKRPKPVIRRTHSPTAENASESCSSTDIRPGGKTK